jgi:hypothetical protein
MKGGSEKEKKGGRGRGGSHYMVTKRVSKANVFLQFLLQGLSLLTPITLWPPIIGKMKS